MEKQRLTRAGMISIGIKSVFIALIGHLVIKVLAPGLIIETTLPTVIYRLLAGLVFSGCLYIAMVLILRAMELCFYLLSILFFNDETIYWFYLRLPIIGLFIDKPYYGEFKDHDLYLSKET